MKMYQLLAGVTLLLLAAFGTSPMVRAQGESGELWVTSQGTERLFIVHGQGSSIETVPVPGIGPHITTFSPLGDYAYVSGMRNGDLSMLRADDRQVVQTLHLGPTLTQDVGSGTGALTAAVAAVAPSSRVIGIDPAAPYVAFAQARHPRVLIRFEVGDGQQLRFFDGSFDRTLSLLVLNFIPDRSKALDEMIRVTRPGGIVASAVWDYGHGMEILRAFWDEAVALNPAADAGDERHMPLSRRGELEALWRAHRLRDVSEEALTIRTRFSSFDDYWSPFLEKQGPAGDYVAGLVASEREQLRLRWRRRLLGEGPDRPIVLDARAWAVRGTVP
jgi:SAM-dependent methyltransferase